MAYSKTFLPSSNNDVVGRLADTTHGLVNQMAGTAAPALESVRESADDVIDNVAAKAAKMEKLRRRMMLNTTDRVRAHPIVALGIAVIAGWLIARMLSTNRSES